MRKKGLPRLALIIMVVLIMLVAFIATSIIRRHVVLVSGNSMYPTFSNGDLLFMDTVENASDLSSDYPVCWVKLDNGRHVIKRLIGYPGDTVELRDGDTYVNGVLIMKRTTDSFDNLLFELGDNEYLFLGDNRSNSADGRYWPGYYVGIENIQGQLKNSGLHS